MDKVFALSAVVAVAATVMVITRREAVHALLYLIVSLFAAAVVMLLLGAAFVAALEVIVYAGAIMVLFVFVIMMIGPERVAIPGQSWIGPSVLAAVLLAELVAIVLRSAAGAPAASRISQLAQVGPARVGIALIGPYVVGVEVSAFLLLAGLVGAYHLGRRRSSGSDDRASEGTADATSAAGAGAGAGAAAPGRAGARARARVEEGQR